MANKGVGILLGLGALAAGIIMLVTRKAKAAPPPPPPPQGLANLYGQVVDASTNQPIAGVLVYLAAVVSRQRLTDSSGNYLIPDIEPGIFDISFTKENYELLPLSGYTIPEGNNELNVQLVPVIVEVGPFAYSGEFFELRPLIELDPDAGTDSVYVVARCTITNPGAVSRTRTIGFYWNFFSLHFGNWWTPTLVKSFDLTLGPGESYQFFFDPRLYPIDIPGGIWTDLLSLSHMYYQGAPMPQTVYLKDDAGGGIGTSYRLLRSGAFTKAYIVKQYCGSEISFKVARINREVQDLC